MLTVDSEMLFRYPHHVPHSPRHHDRLSTLSGEDMLKIGTDPDHRIERTERHEEKRGDVWTTIMDVVIHDDSKYIMKERRRMPLSD